MKKKDKLSLVLALIMIICFGFMQTCIKTDAENYEAVSSDAADKKLSDLTLEDVKGFDGDSYTDYTTLNDGEPYFSDDEITKAKQGSFADYEGLDALGRANGVIASINYDDLPTGERNDSDALHNIRPAGWNQVKYGSEYIEGEYLYNRSHALMYALGGETSERNIFTGTRYLNASLMLPYEEEALSYVKSDKNGRLLYRVTPIYEGENLVPSGVLMEALSLDCVRLDKEDGTSLKYCVYMPNIQPGINIDYSDGSSHLIEDYDGEYMVSSYYSSSSKK
mgnify:CR=1 FL=1